MDDLSNIPELLENVLLQLPIKDLLINAQRVSKTFHNTITGSTKLQRALFFKPVPGPPLNLELSVYPPQWLESPTDQMYHTILKNPFSDLLTMTRHPVDKNFPPSNASALQRPEASWRRMLATQPAVTTVLPHIYAMGPRDPKVCGRSYKHGFASLDYGPVDHSKPQDANQIVHGLTFKVIDEQTPAETRVGGSHGRSVRVLGDQLWLKVEFAWEVRTRVEPKPEWLLRREAQMLGPDEEFREPEPDFPSDYFSDYEDQDSNDFWEWDELVF